MSLLTVLLLLIAVTASALPPKAAHAATLEDSSSLSFGALHSGPAMVAPSLKLRLGAKPAPHTTPNVFASSPEALTRPVATALIAVVEGPLRRRALLRIYRL